MTTRFNATNNGDTPTGYNNKPATDCFIPSCGVEDVDVGVFNLFEKELCLAVGDSSENVKKVPVVFATGERWAMLKKNEPLRDNTNTLILPLISVYRTSMAQSPSEDVVGRGINQQTGELIIKRRLSSNDRAYQSLVNRLNLKNQLNVAVNTDAVSGQLVTGRNVGELQSDVDVVAGGLTRQDRLNNVWEVITIPTPQFFTATYEVTFWTQYNTHMNQLIETFMASMLPWGMCWRIETEKGYWFVATLADGAIVNESNVQKIDGERVIKHKITLKVPGYIVATNNPGAPVPVRRYVSSPMITFAVRDVDPLVEMRDEDESSPYLGDDDPTLPLDASGRSMRRRDMRRTGAGLQYTPIRTDEPYAGDPALSSIPRGRKPGRYTTETYVDKNGKCQTVYRRVSTVNERAGETVYIGDWDGIVIAYPE